MSLRRQETVARMRNLFTTAGTGGIHRGVILLTKRFGRRPATAHFVEALSAGDHSCIKVDKGAKAMANFPGGENHRRPRRIARSAGGVSAAGSTLRQMARGDRELAMEFLRALCSAGNRTRQRLRGWHAGARGNSTPIAITARHLAKRAPSCRYSAADRAIRRGLLDFLARKFCHRLRALSYFLCRNDPLLLKRFDKSAAVAVFCESFRQTELRR